MVIVPRGRASFDQSTHVWAKHSETQMKSFKNCMILCSLFIALVVSTANARPKVGIQYYTWFAYDRPGAQGKGWRDNPFKSRGVRSLAISSKSRGVAYSSRDPRTATLHARQLDELGVDFVIFDCSNFSKTMLPQNNPIFQCAFRAMQGFHEYTDKPIASVFQLSLTCWGEQCHGRPGERLERYTFNRHVRSHIEAIAGLAKRHPEAFLHHLEKPLLLFYINEGSSVLAVNGDKPYFRGAGNLTPTAKQFNPKITLGRRSVPLHDLFTVRFAIVTSGFEPIDYTAFSEEIWPFQCNSEGSEFVEAGFASLYTHRAGERSLPQFRRMVQDAASKEFLVIRSWNEFSSTDEEVGTKDGKRFARVFTIEPNTVVHQWDTTPGNEDPWHMFNGVREIIRTELAE